MTPDIERSIESFGVKWPDQPEVGKLCVWLSFHPKSIMDLRSGIENQSSSREVQRSTFARFLGLFDFRLLQQYRHFSDMAGLAGDVRSWGAKRKTIAGALPLIDGQKSSPKQRCLKDKGQQPADPYRLTPQAYWSEHRPS